MIISNLALFTGGLGVVFLAYSLGETLSMTTLILAAQYYDHIIMLNGGGIYAEAKAAAVVTPNNVKQVYGANACLSPHPINQLPVTLITAGNNRGKDNDNIENA